MSVQVVLVDELLHGQDYGFPMVDPRFEIGDPKREFVQTVMLLFWFGDYPAQGKWSDMLHKGKHACHYCNTLFPAGDNRRYTPADHVCRHDVATYGSPETRDAPALRTNTEVHAAGLTVEQKRWKSQDRKKAETRTGIYGVCFLFLLYLFDVVWDIMPDMMHIVDGILKRYLLPMFCGEKTLRKPDQPNYTYRKKNVTYEHDEAEKKRRKNKYVAAKKKYKLDQLVRSHAHDTKGCDLWTVL
jgi:hypothetical protein